MSQAEPTMRGQPRWSPKLTNIWQVALLPALMAGLAQSKASARLGEDGAVQNTAASAFRPRRRRIRDSDVERDQAVAQGDGRRNIAPGLIGDATAARAKHRLIAQNPAAGDEQFGVSALRRVDKSTAATAGATGDILTNEAGLDEHDAIDIGGAGAGAGTIAGDRGIGDRHVAFILDTTTVDRSAIADHRAAFHEHRATVAESTTDIRRGVAHNRHIPQRHAALVIQQPAAAIRRVADDSARREQQGTVVVVDAAAPRRSARHAHAVCNGHPP